MLIGGRREGAGRKQPAAAGLSCEAHAEHASQESQPFARCLC